MRTVVRGTVLAFFVLLGATAQAAPIDDPVTRYAQALGEANARLRPAARYELAQRFLLLATYYKLDPALLMALVTVESSWHARVVSGAGALGYGQLMPSTAAHLDVDPLEPYENLDGAARYLRRLLNQFATRSYDQRVRLALASYNAGPNAVLRYGGIPPYTQTRAYVVNVLRWRDAYAQLSASTHHDAARILAQLYGKPVAHPQPRHPAHHIAAAATARPPQPIVLAHDRPLYERPELDAYAPDPYETPVPSAPKAQHGLAGFFTRIFHRRHDDAVPAPSSSPQALY